MPAFCLVCVILLIMNRDELEIGWILGIIGVMLLCLVMIYVLNFYPIVFIVVGSRLLILC